VQANSINSLINATLPRDLDKISFSASGKNGKEINIFIADIGDPTSSFSNITVSGKNIDWVSARVKELETFIDDQKNFHWIFRSWIPVIIQVLALATLIAYVMRDNDSNIVVGILSSFTYVFLVRKIFPLVTLETGRSSNWETVRKVLIFVIPVIFLGLIATLISRLVLPP